VASAALTVASYLGAVKTDDPIPVSERLNGFRISDSRIGSPRNDLHVDHLIEGHRIDRQKWRRNRGGKYNVLFDGFGLAVIRRKQRDENQQGNRGGAQCLSS
jgi:hypothetical protein